MDKYLSSQVFLLNFKLFTDEWMNIMLEKVS